MRRLSYTQLVIIDIYREYSRTDLVQYLDDIKDYIDDEALKEEVDGLTTILQNSTDSAYEMWQKEAVGMADAEEMDNLEEE